MIKPADELMPKNDNFRSSDAFGKWIAKDDTPQKQKVNKENKNMTREAQIRQTAAEWLRYNHPTCTQDMLVEAFRCGAEWADKHPQWTDPKEDLPKKVHEGDMWGQVLISKDGFTREATYHFELGKFEVVIGKEGRYIEPDYWMPMPNVPSNYN